MGFFSSSNGKRESAGGKTIIAAGCQINGEFVGVSGALHIDGCVEGVIQSEHDISVGVNGAIKGMVKANTLVVSGTVEGNIGCERIEIMPNGRINGHVVCHEMIIENGGQFVGQRHDMNERGEVSILEDEGMPSGQILELARMVAKVPEVKVLENAKTTD